MSDAGSSELLRRVRTLFGAGAVAGLSDAELLERFRANRATAEDAALAAEAAFTALVARHGPMVLGVCRRALDNPNDVEDAFQATFLVLVRRARSVRVGDSLGRWLYGVARRVAAKARARLERDRRRTAPLDDEPVAPDVSADQLGLLAALDEEVSRLPEKYRAPVVLCRLEGLSHAEAADRLRWPVGTVSGRLSRACDLLRDRLVRRGVASGVALLTSEAVRASVPEPLATATIRAATQLAVASASPAGAVSPSALALMNAVLRAAAVGRLKLAAVVLLTVIMAGAAVGAGVKAAAGARNPARDQNIGRVPTVAFDAASNSSARHRPADEIVQEIEVALVNAAELQQVNEVDLQLMPKLDDVSALPKTGKNVIIVAELNRSLHLRLFDVHGKMVLDSDLKRFTSTWVEYLQQLVPRMWPPHEVTHVERMSVIHAVRSLAVQNIPDQIQRAHDRIASLIGELRTAYPQDVRAAHYLPERWASLIRLDQRAVLFPELREILDTTKDPELRATALYYQTLLRFREPVDGWAAVSLAETFATEAPRDKRAGELFTWSAFMLRGERITALILAATFAILAVLLAATIGMTRWLKYVVRTGVLLLALLVVIVAVWFFLANESLIATLQYASEKFNDGSLTAMVGPFWFGLATSLPLLALAGTIRAIAAVILAALCGVIVVAVRRRSVEPPTRWLAAIRLGTLTFFAVLATCCAVDYGLIGLQRNAIRERILRDYPDSLSHWKP
jgi:RNA polymerase sigma factor (sigma-70 family)